MRTRNKAGFVLVVLCIFLVFSFFIFLGAIFGFDGLQNLKSASFFYLLGKLAGLMGFLFLSLLIFSGDTARYFDRFFGLDKIIKFQRKFALFTMIFVLAHPLFFILSDWSILFFLIPNFSAPPLALGAMSLYIFIMVMVASKMYKRISYNVWQYIHIFTYILFGFSLYHAFYLGSDSGNWLLRAVYLILLAAVAAGAIYRTNYKFKQRRTGKFYVESVKDDNKNVFKLTL